MNKNEIIITGVRFKPAGKIYDFETQIKELEPGNLVVVETEQGLGVARVIHPPSPRTLDPDEQEIKSVLRIVTDEDKKLIEKNNQHEKTAFDFCSTQVIKLGLEMNLFKVESTFDAKKLTFFFTADGRVDFRELVKILVREYHIRIEMRQVGIRHRAKLCGGVGRCGREICCSSYLENFEPISIKMAKVQGLSLNPTKISGVCGRLMCCLHYENDTYKYLHNKLPELGKEVETPNGPGVVTKHLPLKQRVGVSNEEGYETIFDLRDLKSISK
ncbi:MAG: regulatory iron-sulfur-containing complex subunit RicT [Desulforegulaceae bacterium]|nr:regulatory iron-sulfur-containing complex subunit RicT [Desulforegulaceae bacterium]